MTRAVEAGLLALAAILAGSGLVLGLDLVGATGASACSAAPSAGCYPWGAEGPVAGLWSYESKTQYLVAGFGRLAAICAALALLAWRLVSGKAFSPIGRVSLMAALGAATALWFV